MSIGQDEKYREVRDLARQSPGRRLPPERDLALRLGVSRPRVRAILAGLEAEGLVQRRRGSGTYTLDGLAGRLTKVALLIDERLKLGNDPFFSLLAERLQRSLQAQGIRCVVERIEGAPRTPRAEEGILTLGLAGRDVIESLRPHSPPAVGLLIDARPVPNTRVSLFQLADREAGDEAVRRLSRQGCRDVVFVGRHAIASSQNRLAGVEAAAAEIGLPLRFLDSALNYAGGLSAARTLELPVGAAPMGIVATNDWLAVGLHVGLVSQGIAPSAFHIVSFDGLPITDDPALGIESLAVPIEAIAEDGVAELQRLHRSPNAVGRVVSYALRGPAGD